MEYEMKKSIRECKELVSKYKVNEYCQFKENLDKFISSYDAKKVD